MGIDSRTPGIGRRALLRSSMGLPLALAVPGNALAGDEKNQAPPLSSGLITRQKNPGNLGASFSELDVGRLTTPNEKFYVRTHFETPKIDAKSWRLSIEGAVEHPFEIGYDELLALPSQTMPALLECPGNGRGFLDPPQIGIRWEMEAVSVADQPFNGFFQTFMYTMWERKNGLPTLIPTTDIQVKSQVARPAPYEVVAQGVNYRMIGAAWAGEADPMKIEVSVDGGKTWAEARFTTDPVRFAWRFWEHDWRTPDRPSPVVVMARATDSKGRVQPMERDPDRRDGVITHVLPIEVEVR